MNIFIDIRREMCGGVKQEYAASFRMSDIEIFKEKVYA